MPGTLEFEEIVAARSPQGYGGRFYGAYPALVQDIVDPDNQGRVKVALPWSPDSGGSSYQAWARVATLMAGNNQGSWFIPDANVEVLVIFLGGDPRHPCVIGALWNGQDSPPQSMDSAGDNNVKQICSRNGVKITLDDTSGSESLTLETPGGQKIALQDGPGSILIQDSNGNSVQLDTSGITINAASQVTISASQATVTASMVSVNAGMSTFSGVTQHDTVITNSVVSASYTPGAGNIW
ncbi:MAG TPA: phage baseplate assembly protein V [Bryobacteraceae bacterium]|nr:phage baseplate assembly protein V [Bryobacteraceae bacterium]